VVRAREVLAEHEAAERRLTGHLTPGAAARPSNAADDLHADIAAGAGEASRSRFEPADAAGGAKLAGGTEEADRNVLGPAPSAADVFATGDRKLFRKHGCVIGENCRALGFNVDFAPVLDLAFEASRSVMSSRAVSANPKEVVTYTREFLRGLHDAGILGCGKHFPGLGEANLDTHHDLPSVTKPFNKLWEQDLIPYRIMRRELPLVMVSHAAFPAVTRERTPASLSRKWITDILRKKIGYRGLVCSDDLEMGGVLAAAPIEQAASGHIRAGGDLALICHQEDFIRRAHEAMILETERDRRFAARVQESMRRVLAFKKKHLARQRASTPATARIEKLTRHLWEFGEEIRMATLDHALLNNDEEHCA
jgi:beta-N-acetylhexosaminidase